MSETNEIKLLKNKQINNFMAQFEDLKKVNVDEIEKGLKEILNETPGVDFEYGVDFELNENTGDEDRIESLKKIHILYTFIDDDVNMPRIGKISYVVG